MHHPRIISLVFGYVSHRILRDIKSMPVRLTVGANLCVWLFVQCVLSVVQRQLRQISADFNNSELDLAGTDDGWLDFKLTF